MNKDTSPHSGTISVSGTAEQRAATDELLAALTKHSSDAVAILTASDAQAYDYYGMSVALSGNRLVVGSPGASGTVHNAGKVYVYDWNGTVYIPVLSMSAADAQAGDNYGVSVALSGNRLVVGAHLADTAAVNAGKVYVYDWNGAAYVQVLMMTASDAQAYAYYGISVALYGNRLAVGAHGADTTALSAGKVYVYDWNGAAYEPVLTTSAVDAQTDDNYGVSVALFVNRLIVGAPGASAAVQNNGKIYAYDWNGAAYVPVLMMTASDAPTSDYYGVSAALSGNRLVVSAYAEDTAAPDAGKVYVYDWDGTAYVEVLTMTVPTAPAGDCYGISVALSGNRLIVGTYGDDRSAATNDKVYSGDLKQELVHDV